MSSCGLALKPSLATCDRWSEACSPFAHDRNALSHTIPAVHLSSLLRIRGKPTFYTCA